MSEQLKLKTIKIFLASSSELKNDRIELEIAIQRKNDELIKRGIYLDFIVWEDFLDKISNSRLQNEYNKAILQCDIFVMLFFTKVGKFTLEEFQVAYNNFIKKGRPKIFTYFKNAPIQSDLLNETDMISMFSFKKELQEIGHYVSNYSNSGDLKFHFSEQLNKLMIHDSNIIRIAESEINENSNTIKERSLSKTTLFVTSILLVLLLLFGYIIIFYNNSPNEYDQNITMEDNFYSIIDVNLDSLQYRVEGIQEGFGVGDDIFIVDIKERKGKFFKEPQLFEQIKSNPNEIYLLRIAGTINMDSINFDIEKRSFAIKLGTDWRNSLIFHLPVPITLNGWNSFDIGNSTVSKSTFELVGFFRFVFFRDKMDMMNQYKLQPIEPEAEKAKKSLEILQTDSKMNNFVENF